MERFCFNCNMILKNGNNMHWKKCIPEMEYSNSRYKQLLFDFKNLDLSIENIKKLYINDSWSLLDFKKNYGLAFNQTRYLLNIYGIILKDMNQINHQKNIKYKNTCLIKYGIQHSTTSGVVEKIKKTSIEKYGVDNIFKSKDFIINNRKKLIEKYGKLGFGWKNTTPEDKIERIKKLHEASRIAWKNPDRIRKPIIILSSLEVRIENILIKERISFHKQIWINSKENKKCYDFLFGNNILEINGDFWHGNPIKYKSDDILYNGLSVFDVWDKDKKKMEIAKSSGYKVFYLWESEMKIMSDIGILKFINELINFN